MNEHPVLFSAPMVQAILAGRKTQTRRVIKGVALSWLQPEMFSPDFVALQDNKLSPYGYAGDLLWVRETWATERRYDSLSPSEILEPGEADLWWDADGSSLRRLNGRRGKTRPSIHMPRWASRITLEVVNIRVERLNCIVTEDIIAEGTPTPNPPPNSWMDDAKWRSTFAYLWDSINAKRGFGWDTKPWVWVVEFKIQSQ